jgi:hypothetical protein
MKIATVGRLTPDYTHERRENDAPRRADDAKPQQIRVTVGQLRKST